MKKLTLSLSVSICILFAISVQAQVGQDQARNYEINEAHTGSSSSPGLAPPLKQKWNVNFGWPISYPLIADGKVFVTVKNAPVTSGTTLFALNAGDGSTLWSINLNLGGGFSFWSALCYENGRVFVLTHEGRLAALDGSTGSVIWSQQLPGQFSFNSPPTVFQGVVYAVVQVMAARRMRSALTQATCFGRCRWPMPVAVHRQSLPRVFIFLIFA